MTPTEDTARAEAPTPTDEEIEATNSPTAKRIAELERELAACYLERDQARETAGRLNRRALQAEGIIAKSGIVEGRPQGNAGRSFGRALANYAAATMQRERDDLRALLADAEAKYSAAYFAWREEVATLKAALERAQPHP